MISFEVNDMTCGHCVSSLTKALQAADATAKLRFDLAAHRVDIEPGMADAAELSEAIKLAGVHPCRSTVRMTPTRRRTGTKGCCCS